jgi:hypothetical protein
VPEVRVEVVREVQQEHCVAEVEVGAVELGMTLYCSLQISYHLLYM